MDEPSGHPSMSTGLSSTSTMNITPKVEKNAWEISSRFNANGPSDTSLFSSSLPVLTHEKLNFIDLENRPIEDASAELHKLTKDADDTESVGILLPDEEELFAGIADDFDFSGLPDQVVEGEEYDLFGSGGGMELDFDPTENLAASMSKTNINDGYLGNGSVQHSIPNGVGAVAGEHPYGEHPSRTLFVRNINSNVDDLELRSLFEQYGDIRTLYTACKHRGFVMISYFDIRAARSAMRALQNRAVRRRKLDIHFSIPKENPSDKDINQGTLVIFNLDPSVTNEDLRRIFGIYGEVKEIRETPHKRHHKFIEFYDVRAAEAALRGLNRIEIAGKRIKLEHSRPGGARRNLIQQLNQDLDHDETRSYIHQVGSPVPNSPPGFWAFNSPSDNSPLRPLSQSPTSGLGSMLPPLLSNSVKISPIGKEQSLRIPFQQSHSFPEHSGIMPTYMTSNSANLNSVGPPTSGASLGTLTGAQFLWGSSTTYSDRNQTSVCQKLPIGHSFTTNVQGRGFPYSIRQGSTSIPSSYHHVGSAPSGVPFDRHFGFGHFPESPESSFMSQLPFGGSGMSCNEGNLLMSMGSHGRSIIPGMPPRLGHILPGSSPYSGSGSVGTEGFFQHGKSRRVENSGSQIESQQQYQLDLEKIVSGEDTRTTLMIKNIPNKYTSKMLLAAIDEIHKGTYDFFYLPIDFKNKCNVGYAFINMVSPSHIVPFYQAFNGKKWEKFNSEKVALLAYARIQGKSALVAHFQNSSLMNEDRRCRPILFHSEEEEAIVQDMQELFSSNGLNYYVRHSDSSLALDSLESSTSNNPGSGR